jgi:hypothetical protein
MPKAALLCFIPGHNWREANLVQSGEEGEECEQERGNDELIFIEELQE